MFVVCILQFFIPSGVRLGTIDLRGVPGRFLRCFHFPLAAKQTLLHPVYQHTHTIRHSLGYAVGVGDAVAQAGSKGLLF